MAIQTGGNVSKSTAFAVVSPPQGTSAAKAVAYAVLSADSCVDMSKAVSYVIVSPPQGTLAAKAVAYAVLSADSCVDLSKAVAYAVLAPAFINTTTTITAERTSSLEGTAVTLTATTDASATGTVTFRDGTDVIGTATVTAGAASFTTSALLAGDHNLTATYSGDATFASSVSAALPLTVIPVPAVVLVPGAAVLRVRINGSFMACPIKMWVNGVFKTVPLMTLLDAVQLYDMDSGALLYDADTGGAITS